MIREFCLLGHDDPGLEHLESNNIAVRPGHARVCICHLLRCSLKENGGPSRPCGFEIDESLDVMPGLVLSRVQMASILQAFCMVVNVSK